MENMLTAALEWMAAGCSVIRVSTDGTKAPYGKWKEFQSRCASEFELNSWFREGYPGLGIVCGAISGNLEMLELEGRAIQDGLIEQLGKACIEAGLADVWTRICTGAVVISPSGGSHFYYRVDSAVPGNTKLAERAARQDEFTRDEKERFKSKGITPRRTLIETRGEGGFVVAPPSSGSVHPTGQPWIWFLETSPRAIPTLSGEEREALHGVCRTFDEPSSTVYRVTESVTLPGTDFNERGEWSQVLEPHGWQAVYTRGERTFWRRPGKSVGVSAVTGGGGSDYMFVWTTSTELPSMRALSKWAVYTELEHRGDFNKAASALSALGYGTALSNGEVKPKFTPIDLGGISPLVHVSKVFRKWLDLDDLSPVYFVAATIVANKADGNSPQWGLLVGPPSSAKTEIIQSVTLLDYVYKSATVTEAGLLSGTGKRDTVKGATGGLLRKIGDFGIIALKDFTSVLSQNRDTLRAALGALREVYDGNWTRNVGSDGGKTLHWEGKCGLIGGVTPTVDKYGTVITALGDRFLLLRLAEPNPDPMASMALTHIGQEDIIRTELSEAMCTLIESADESVINYVLSEHVADELKLCAKYVARARTAVERDSYKKTVEVMPVPEGTGRLVLSFARLYGGLHAIGLTEDDSLLIVRRVARDCVPAVRTPVLRLLLNATSTTSLKVVAERLAMPKSTCSYLLEDLELIGLLEGSNYGYVASKWLRECEIIIDQDAALRIMK